MNTVFDNDQFESIYPDGIENHYWTYSRNYIIYKSLLKNSISKDKIIEIGCGRGIVVKYLNDKEMDCIGVELAECKPYAGAEKNIFTQTDAVDLNQTLRDECNVLLLLDVLEHIKEPTEFLNIILGKYKFIKTILITVPARNELWSNYDEFNGHFRRYDLDMAENIFKGVNFEVIENRYFFHSLYSIMKLIMDFSGKRETRIFAPKGIMKILHTFLSFLFIIEYYLLPKVWKGSSIICVGRKNN